MSKLFNIDGDIDGYDSEIIGGAGNTSYVYDDSVIEQFCIYREKNFIKVKQDLIELFLKDSKENIVQLENKEQLENILDKLIKNKDDDENFDKFKEEFKKFMYQGQGTTEPGDSIPPSKTFFYDKIIADNKNKKDITTSEIKGQENTLSTGCILIGVIDTSGKFLGVKSVSDKDKPLYDELTNVVKELSENPQINLNNSIYDNFLSDTCNKKFVDDYKKKFLDSTEFTEFNNSP